jgi:hypothetical protein
MEKKVDDNKSQDVQRCNLFLPPPSDSLLSKGFLHLVLFTVD